jgi:predicted SAM-dependent methyltransferase
MFKFFDEWVNYDNPNSLGNRFRNRRFEFVSRQILSLPKPVKILDVGGTEKFWKNRGFVGKDGIQIFIINLVEYPTEHPNIRSIIGDATNLSMFADNEFDFVFSNSVIEHLYTFENQKKMAMEIIRVGNYHLVQTPNRYFFIEPHFVFPFFQFLPKEMQTFILTRTRLSRGRRRTRDWAEDYLNQLRLLSLKEFERLFPGDQIFQEKLLGMTKSFTAYNF